MNTIPNYSLDELVLQSSDVVLHRGRRIDDGVAVTIKTLGPSPGRPAAQVRLRHEFQLLRQLDVPGVPHALALETFPGGRALILEAVAGESLATVLARGPARGARGARARRRAGRGARGGASAGADPQAAGPAVHRVRRRRAGGQPGGLRLGVAAGAGAGAVDPVRRRRGGPRVHLARADRAHEPDRRHAIRPVRARRDPLRGAGRGDPVRAARRAARSGPRAHRPAPAAAARGRGRRAGDGVPRDRPAARQDRGGPLPDGERAAPRPRALPRGAWAAARTSRSSRSAATTRTASCACRSGSTGATSRSRRCWRRSPGCTPARPSCCSSRATRASASRCWCARSTSRSPSAAGCSSPASSTSSAAACRTRRWARRCAS
jgi:hypothetical protein